MPLSVNGSRDALQPLTPSEDRRRMGRYLAVGAVLAVTLLTLHHVLLRDASTIAGVCIPTTIMACYVLWILYSVRRDKRKYPLNYNTEVKSNVTCISVANKYTQMNNLIIQARLLASAMQLTEVISSEASDASDHNTKTRTMRQTLGHEMMGMIATSGKSPATQLSRTRETNGIPVNNDKDPENIIT